MNKTTALIALASLAASLTPCAAQNKAADLSKIPPPKQPILARAPARAEWTISVRYDRTQAQEEFLNPEKKKAQPEGSEGKVPPILRPKEIKVSKDGTTYREAILWNNGKRTVKWIADGFQVRELSHNGEVARIDLTSYPTDFSDYSRSDFEVAQWVEKDTYIGPRMLKDAAVYQFGVDAAKRRLTPREIALHTQRQAAAEAVTEIADDANIETATPLGDLGGQGDGSRRYVALLDVETQLPLLVDDGNVTYLYQYSTPVGRLSVPEKFSREFEAWKNLIKTKGRVPTPP